MSKPRTQTLTQQLAARLAAGIVDQQMHALAVIDTMATYLLYTAMAISYFHQVGFLLSIAHLTWTTPEDLAHSVPTFAAILAVPLAVDFLTIMCVKVLGAKAIHRTSKQITMGFLLIPVGLSGAINGAAPSAHPILTVVFVAPVVFIVISESIKLLAARVDLTAVGAAEADVAAQAGPAPKPTSRRCGKGCTCGKHHRKARTAQAARADEQRARNAAAFAEVATILDPTYQDSAAPVSPALATS